MPYTVLYRKKRPRTFAQIVDQKHVVEALRNQLRAGRFSHAYLFCGTRGTGKTTTARLLAKGVNCTSNEERPCGTCENCNAIKDGVFIDVIEIDAASNNGVDNIRELKESVKYPPAVGIKKVYIIDEVHMLSPGAYNALLKTLEEPPEHVMFILATTDPQKLPSTILSRCMRLDFKRISENLLIEGMKKICDEKEIDVSESALRLIAINADGSVRDGLSILDQCLASGEQKVSRDDVLELIGAAGEEVFLEIAEMIKTGDVGGAFLALDQALSDGKDARQALKDLLAHYRNLLIVKFIKEPENILNISSENAERIKAQSDTIPLADINRAITEISKATSEAKWSTHPRVLLELCIAMLADNEEPEIKTTSKVAAPNATKSKNVTKQADPVNDAPIEQKQDYTSPGNDNSRLWNSIFEGDDGLKGSLKMIQNSAEIKATSESEYTIATQTDFVKDLITKNKNAIEAILQNRSGTFKAIKCVNEEKPESNETNSKSTSELAAEVGNILGLDIEIED